MVKQLFSIANPDRDRVIPMASSAIPDLAPPDRGSSMRQGPTTIPGPDQSSSPAVAASHSVAYEEYNPGLQVHSDTPGLEAAPASPRWLERAVPDSAGLMHVARDDKIYISGEHDVGRHEDEKTAQGKNKKRSLFVLGLVALVIVAAVLGGTLGTLLKPGSTSGGDGRDTPNDTPTSTSTVANPASMTGSSTSVGFYTVPTAISWGPPHLQVFESNPQFGGYAITAFRRDPNATSPTDFSSRQANNSAWIVTAKSVEFDQDLRFSVQPRFRAGRNWTELLYLNSQFLRRATQDSSGNWFLNESFSSTKPNDTPEGQAWSAKKESLTLAPSGDEWHGYTAMFLTRGANGILQMGTVGVSGIGHDGVFPSLKDGKVFSSPPLAFLTPRVVDAGNKLHFFAVADENRHLLHGAAAANQGWTVYGGVGGQNMEDLGGFVTSTPAVVARDAKNMDVFARGGDGRLWWKACYERDGGGDWSSRNWTTVDPDVKILGEPEAISWSENRIDVFVWGEATMNNNSLLHRTYTFSGSTLASSGTWMTVASGLTGPPKALSDKKGRMYVFAHASSGTLWRTWQEDGGWLGQAEKLPLNL
ncbi:hypothetical protein RB594_003507 [Gaeumannomyces avenae]